MLTLHPFKLSNFFSIQEPLSISWVRNFLFHNGSTAPKRERCHIFAAATQKLLCKKETILLHVHGGDLCVGVCFGIAHSLVVDNLLRTSADCVIRKIFQTKREVLPWHSFLAAILSALKPDRNTCRDTLHAVVLLIKKSNDTETNTLNSNCITNSTQTSAS